MTDQPRLALSPQALVVALTLTVAVAAAALAGLLVLVDRADWWRGYLGATVVSVLAFGASLGPLVWGLKGDLNRALIGWFVAAALRFVVSIGGCALAVKVGGYPATPTFLLMVGYYFAALIVEAVVMAKAMWSAKATRKD